MRSANLLASTCFSSVIASLPCLAALSSLVAFLGQPANLKCLVEPWSIHLCVFCIARFACLAAVRRKLLGVWRASGNRGEPNVLRGDLLATPKRHRPRTPVWSLGISTQTPYRRRRLNCLKAEPHPGRRPNLVDNLSRSVLFLATSGGIVSAALIALPRRSNCRAGCYGQPPLPESIPRGWKRALGRSKRDWRGKYLTNQQDSTAYPVVSAAKPL